jgi:hypothetical protein
LIDCSVGRLGIGKDEEERQLKRKRQEEAEEMMKKLVQDQVGKTEEFKDRMREKFLEQRTLRLVKECRVVCEQLDKEAVKDSSNFVPILFLLIPSSSFSSSSFS